MGAKTPEKTSEGSEARSPFSTPVAAQKLDFGAAQEETTSTEKAIASFIGRDPSAVSDFLVDELSENAEAVQELSKLALVTDKSELLKGLIAIANKFNLDRRLPREKTSSPAPSQLLEQSSATMMAAVRLLPTI